MRKKSPSVSAVGAGSLLAAFAMCLAIFQHRGNIRRLLNGTEPDFKAAKKDKAGGPASGESKEEPNNTDN